MSPGFACGPLACFKPFWPLALSQQARPAIIFHALRRLGGAVLFRSSRPSPSWGYPFWPSGLTVRRSRPPTAAAELRATRASPPLQAIPLPGLIAQRSTQAWFSSISDQFQPCACSASMLLGKRCGRLDYKRSLTLPSLLAADPDERRAPGAPFVSRASGFLPWLPQSSPSIPRRRSNPLHINDCLHATDF